MKQIGNLAIVCATRPEVSLQLYKHRVFVCVGQGPQRASLCARWDDDEAIRDIIQALNFGAYSPGKLAETTALGQEPIHMKTREGEQ
mgnify:CR=1 FL=1